MMLLGAGRAECLRAEARLSIASPFLLPSSECPLFFESSSSSSDDLRLLSPEESGVFSSFFDFDEPASEKVGAASNAFAEFILTLRRRRWQTGYNKLVGSVPWSTPLHS